MEYTSFFTGGALIRAKGWRVRNCWLFTRSERWKHICALRHHGAFQTSSEATAYKSRLLSCLTKTPYPLNKKFINVIKQTMTKHSPLCQEKPILPPEKKKSFSNPFYVSAPSLFSLCSLSCSHSLSRSLSLSVLLSFSLSLSSSLASFLSSRTKRSSSQ